MSCRIAVLISGFGSNLQAMIDACSAGQIDGEIVAVISNRGDALGLERARHVGIETRVVANADHSSRESYDAALAETLEPFKPDLIVMAGFMRILTGGFIQRYAGRMLNIHPSLLPKYKGLHTHRQALEAGDSEHGCSVHFVTETLDGGPVVCQARVPVLPGDDEHSLALRVHQQEHRIYPLVVSWFAEGRLSMDLGKACLDGKQLPVSGHSVES